MGFYKLLQTKKDDQKRERNWQRFCGLSFSEMNEIRAESAQAINEIREELLLPEPQKHFRP